MIRWRLEAMANLDKMRTRANARKASPAEPANSDSAADSHARVCMRSTLLIKTRTLGQRLQLAKE
eukprot:7056640-Alexandrium_andersonii.AAC.1